MKVIPKIGIDKLVLGMTMDQVRGVWGDPISIERSIPLEDSPEDHSIDWEYGNKITLNFDSEESFVLSDITIESEEVMLCGFFPVGLSARELKLKFPKIEHDDEFELAVDVYKLEKQEITFWIREGRVWSFTIGPEYNDSGTEIIWPKHGN